MLQQNKIKLQTQYCITNLIVSPKTKHISTYIEANHALRVTFIRHEREAEILLRSLKVCFDP